MQVAPDLVHDFAIRGGYRFVLNQIAYPEKMTEGKRYVIHHSWKNTGVGKLPNSLKNWGYKYKLSFALLNKDTGNLSYQMLDMAESPDGLKGFEYKYQSRFCPRDVPPGTYHFGIASVNTANKCEPEIKLAIGNERTNRFCL
ncbi:hypothetical protein [Paenibacillus sp. Soil750]|uniref:hypothetical protein n=1 Tax=Paenibacillus sp. Soil750 TaxID=1736398 RepID=UPI0006FFB022|nr:hypothetical protein ASL11_14930 [Paenibacillus sp. Soil750]